MDNDTKKILTIYSLIIQLKDSFLWKQALKIVIEEKLQWIKDNIHNVEYIKNDVEAYKHLFYNAGLADGYKNILKEVEISAEEKLKKLKEKNQGV